MRGRIYSDWHERMQRKLLGKPVPSLSLVSPALSQTQYHKMAELGAVDVSALPLLFLGSESGMTEKEAEFVVEVMHICISLSHSLKWLSILMARVMK